jgi:LEA14-like dessication related protein
MKRIPTQLASRSLPVLGLAALLLLPLGGCSGLSMTPPDLSLVDLEFTDLTLFESTGTFTVRILNENPDPLTIDGGVFKIYLNGLKVGKGVTSERIEVPRLESTTAEVSLHVSNVALAARIRDLLQDPVLNYTLKSKLFVVKSYGTRKATFNHSGRIDLSGKDLAPDRAPVTTESIGR